MSNRKLGRNFCEIWILSKEASGGIVRFKTFFVDLLNDFLVQLVVADGGEDFGSISGITREKVLRNIIG